MHDIQCGLSEKVCLSLIGSSMLIIPRVQPACQSLHSHTVPFEKSKSLTQLICLYDDCSKLHLKSLYFTSSLKFKVKIQHYRFYTLKYVYTRRLLGSTTTTYVERPFVSPQGAVWSLTSCFKLKRGHLQSAKFENETNLEV